INPNAIPTEPSLLRRVVLFIAGADKETLSECPFHDYDVLRNVALLFVLAWMYQTAILALVAHQIFNHDGTLQPMLVLGAAFIASLVLVLDSFVFCRSGHHTEGLSQLKRGGLDLGGRFGSKLTALLFLAMRLLFSIVLAQLTAIFVGLIVFHQDILAA